MQSSRGWRARRHRQPGRFRAPQRRSAQRWGWGGAGALSCLPPPHPGHSEAAGTLSRSHSPTGAHSPAREPDGCPTALGSRGGGPRFLGQGSPVILPGGGGLESENPRSGVLAGEFSESRGRAVRRSGKDSRVLDSQERWVQRLILGLFSTLKPSHCSGGKKGEFRWGQEEAEQGGGPGGVGTEHEPSLPSQLHQQLPLSSPQPPTLYSGACKFSFL